MEKPGIHIAEHRLLQKERFDHCVSSVKFLKLLKEHSIGTEKIRVDGLDYLLLVAPSCGVLVRKAIIDAENILFNRKPVIIFSVEKITLGEYQKLVVRHHEIDLLPIFGTLIPQGKGHLFIDRL